MKWTQSLGGPLVLMDQKNLPKWSGASEDIDDPDSDYSRACRQYSDIWVLSKEGFSALILAGQRDQMHAKKQDSCSFFLIGWRYSESEQIAESALSAALSDRLSFGENFEFLFESGDIVLSDAVLPGDRFKENIQELEVGAGLYSVATAKYQPNEDTFFLLHRFLKTD